tara:strand:- start:1051 stop:1578 length:528 start_codon:yes stop_codon:yes gene_type:complete
MGQEFFIKSDDLESKIRELLPSQGGLGAGFDLSASTQIIPIIDLTEQAEGSSVRPDLQTALSFNDVSVFDVGNTTTTIVTNTGYFRIFGNVNGVSNASSARTAQFRLSDGATTKKITEYAVNASSNLTNIIISFDFLVFIPAGQSLEVISNSNDITVTGCTKQIATIDGILTQPS